jgi:hypothetical protein
MITQIDINFIETHVVYRFKNNVEVYLDQTFGTNMLLKYKDILDPMDNNFHIPVLDKIEMLIKEKSHN